MMWENSGFLLMSV